jgi:TolB-like protein/DNA-binding winged helix-turn-helix (wHTH) protein/tetratricopeptide (TPR) repeat protein
MPTPDQSRTLRFGDFELDPAAFELRRDGRVVRLGRQPMDVLLLLIERRGQLVSRADIIDRLWGKDVFVDVDTGVNTAISKIRQALRDSAEAPLFVETVPGRGYRFVAAIEDAQPAPLPSQANPPSDTAPDAAPAPVVPEAGRRGRRLVTAAILVLSVTAAGAGLWFYAARSAPDRVSLAVLPFVNLGNNPEHQYLADGFTDETAASLAQVDPEHLSVKGRTLRYKGTDKSVAEIGRELVVDYLLESSILIEGTRARVTAKLIRVRDEEHVWSQSYEREPTSFIAFQQELSSAIAEQIRLRLPADRVTGIARRQTRNTEAYDAYLRGRHFQGLRTPESTGRAVALFERAVALDPDYALAWSALAFTRAAGTINSDTRPLDVWPLARDAAAQAIRANPGLAEAQLTAGYLNWLLAWDWKRAEAAFREATRLDPSSVEAYRLLGHLLSQLGRHSEADAAMRRARQLDPAAALEVALSSQVAFQARDYATAVSYARQAILLDSRLWIGYMQLAQAYEQLGEDTLALEALDDATRLSGRNSKAVALRGYIFGKTGRTGEAQEVLNLLAETARQRYVPPTAFATIHAALGNADAMFDWLNKAIEAQDVHLIFLPVDAKWDRYRGDPRFAALLARCAFAR